MAIKSKVSTVKSQGETLQLDLYNGDLKALREVVDSWQLKDEKSLIQFAIAVFQRAKGKKVYLLENDNFVGFSPSEEITKPKDLKETDISELS